MLSNTTKKETESTRTKGIKSISVKKPWYIVENSKDLLF